MRNARRKLLPTFHPYTLSYSRRAAAGIFYRFDSIWLSLYLEIRTELRNIWSKNFNLFSCCCCCCSPFLASESFGTIQFYFILLLSRCILCVWYANAQTISIIRIPMHDNESENELALAIGISGKNEAKAINSF